MKSLLRMVALSLLLLGGFSLPAAADSGDRDIDYRDWSQGPRFFYTGPVERPQARWSGRTTYGTRHAQRHAAAPRHRYAQRHHTRRHVAQHSRKARGNAIAHRPTKAPKVAVQRKEPKVAVQREPAAPKPAPSPSRREGSAPKSSGQVGVASYYWQGQRVASGGWFNPNAMTAAHRTLPFGTRVRVTHLGNGRSVEVMINDRGPFIAGRIIDLSRAAAGVIGMTGQGIARVSVEVLGRGVAGR